MQISDKNLLLRRASAVLTLALLGVALLLGAHTAGRQHAQEDIRLLGTVWPDVMQMDKASRSFLVALALSCELRKNAANRDEVIDCLRRASTEDRLAAKGYTDGPSRLDTMIQSAPPSLYMSGARNP